MKTDKSKIEVHVFVCTNQKPPGKACCAPVGGAAVRDSLKKLVSEDAALASRVRINASGCLDKCSNGVAAVIYPQGEWLVNITEQDVPDLLAKVKQHLPPT